MIEQQHHRAGLRHLAVLDLVPIHERPNPLQAPNHRVVIRVDLPRHHHRPDRSVKAAATLPASGHLLDALDALPIERLSDDQALDVVVAAKRLIARAEALQVRAIARFAKLRPAEPDEGSSDYAPDLGRYAPDELGCALGISRMAAGRKIEVAGALVHRLSATLAALHGGQIDAYKAAIIADRAGDLEPAKAAAVEQRVLVRAERQTHPQLRAAVNRAVLRLDPNAALQRRKANVAQRHVELMPQDDGVSELCARLPSELAAACYDRLCQLAEKAKTPDDERTSDQRRADVFTDLLLGTTTGGGVQAHILVLTRETSLLRVDDEPGELVGSGPLPAQVVREIAEQHPNSIWRRLLTDAKSGVVTDLGRTRYRPTAGLDEFVRLRALTCYFPGCRRPATRCDFNHLQAASKGGATSAANGGPACRHHHPMTDGKNPKWQVRQPLPGVYEVTSPTGRTYTNDLPPLLEPPEQKPPPEHDPPPF